MWYIATCRSKYQKVSPDEKVFWSQMYGYFSSMNKATKFSREIDAKVRVARLRELNPDLFISRVWFNF